MFELIVMAILVIVLEFETRMFVGVICLHVYFILFFSLDLLCFFALRLYVRVLAVTLLMG